MTTLDNLAIISREAGRWKDDYLRWDTGERVEDDYESTFSQEVAGYASDKMYLQIVVAVIEALAQEAEERGISICAYVYDKNKQAPPLYLDDWLRSHLESSGQSSGQTPPVTTGQEDASP